MCLYSESASVQSPSFLYEASPLLERGSCRGILTFHDAEWVSEATGMPLGPLHGRDDQKESPSKRLRRYSRLTGVIQAVGGFASLRRSIPGQKDSIGHKGSIRNVGPSRNKTSHRPLLNLAYKGRNGVRERHTLLGKRCSRRMNYET